MQAKGELPPAWFSSRIRGNPDSIALAPDSLRRLEQQHTWVEWKVLRTSAACFRAELLAGSDREFWEVTDRGVNFDHSTASARKSSTSSSPAFL